WARLRRPGLLSAYRRVACGTPRPGLLSCETANIRDGSTAAPGRRSREAECARVAGDIDSCAHSSSRPLRGPPELAHPACPLSCDELCLVTVGRRHCVPLSCQVLTFTSGQIVQEFGYDDDVDHDLRDAIEDLLGEDLEDGDSQEIVDDVIMWCREGDGDL